MNKQTLKAKRHEWLRRYIPGEILGTFTGLIGAWIVFAHTHSYISAAASGWISEGIGFYGYFIVVEILANNKKLNDNSFLKRAFLAISSASSNLIVEFMPAKILDNLVIRPFAMYSVPHYVHPYPLGFLVGKFSADIIFYILAILGYETRKRLLNR